MFFREASDPGLVQSLRIYKKTDAEITKASAALRELGGIENDAPLNSDHIFLLLKSLGVNLVFSDFHEKIKAYALYTNINNHRVVFVNFEIKIPVFVFCVLHESIHSIRDESNAYDASFVYSNEEEDFCDNIASHAQLTDKYLLFLHEAIQELDMKTQLTHLLNFLKKINTRSTPFKNGSGIHFLNSEIVFTASRQIYAKSLRRCVSSFSRPGMPGIILNDGSA